MSRLRDDGPPGHPTSKVAAKRGNAAPPSWATRENRLTLRYWESVGGTLVLEFHVVAASATSAKRVVDAIILPDGPTMIAKAKDVAIAGHRVVVVQTKAYPMDLVNFGQALGGAALLEERFRPASVRAVAVCVGHDEAMEQLAARFGVEVVVFEAADAGDHAVPPIPPP